jgi:hypothetical protein
MVGFDIRSAKEKSHEPSNDILPYVTMSSGGALSKTFVECAALDVGSPRPGVTSPLGLSTAWVAVDDGRPSRAEGSPAAAVA